MANLPSALVSALAAGYRLEREIGAGGMGSHLPARRVTATLSDVE